LAGIAANSSERLVGLRLNFAVMEKAKTSVDLKGMLDPKTSVHVPGEEMRHSRGIETRLDELDVSITKPLNALDKSLSDVVRMTAILLALTLVLAYKEFFG
jgi:hypothetical protein